MLQKYPKMYENICKTCLLVILVESLALVLNGLVGLDDIL